MRNFKTTENYVNADVEAATECKSTKPRYKHKVPWGVIAVRKKRDDEKRESLYNKRKTTKSNAKKLKRTKAYQKEQNETLKVRLIR